MVNSTVTVMLTEGQAQCVLLPIGIIGLIFGIVQIFWLRKLTLDQDGHELKTRKGSGSYDELQEEREEEQNKEKIYSVREITEQIQEGAESFLMAEYSYCAVFIVIMCLVLFFSVEAQFGQAYTTMSFFAGAVTSIIAGYVGMKVAVYANGRVALQAQKNLQIGFITAFRAGSVMGFCLTSLGLLVLLLLLFTYNKMYAGIEQSKYFKMMYESIAGYGLGGSSIALFGRVGGGIYTKAADVGADLVGKVENSMNEDSPRNPGTIADNVGDNVGDVAGMGADLFGSFAESSSATLVVAATITEFQENRAAMYFPVAITGFGILVCLICSFIATNFSELDEGYTQAMKEGHEEKVLGENVLADVEGILKRQLVYSTILMTPATYLACYMFLPSQWTINSAAVPRIYAFYAVSSGLWGGLIIGFVTEYYTSYAYTPTQDVAKSCTTGAATNIIYGLALGYLSCIVPTIILALTAYVSHKMLGMFGIGLAALGMLSTLSLGLTIDAYGPISDNAGGIAEMCSLGKDVRDKTDALDAAGNTTAAIGKGFAIGSAALVGMALFGAYVTRLNNKEANLDLMLCDEVIKLTDPMIFSGLIIGAMLPYAFSAMTMKSVGKAALQMVEEIRRQIREHPGIITGETVPDYDACIRISTEASLREMIPPGILVMGTPILLGIVFGPKAVAGLLPGATVSGIQMAISASNTGGAWDNAKKYIEAGKLQILNDDGEIERYSEKHTAEHDASVIGDTVGDPLKDTSGPSLNILVKLSAIISLIFARVFQIALLANALGENYYLCKQ